MFTQLAMCNEQKNKMQRNERERKLIINFEIESTLIECIRMKSKLIYQFFAICMHIFNESPSRYFSFRLFTFFFFVFLVTGIPKIQYISIKTKQKKKNMNREY